jgi:hypothetical protein
MGIVAWNGQRYPGKHERLVDEDTFDKVQGLLSAANVKGERPQKHEHYLRGTVVCDECLGRLLYGHHRGRSGRQYDYFCCNNRAVRRHKIQCSSGHYSVDTVEQRVEELYRTVRLDPKVQEQIRAELRQAKYGLTIPGKSIASMRAAAPESWACSASVAPSPLVSQRPTTSVASRGMAATISSTAGDGSPWRHDQSWTVRTTSLETSSRRARKALPSAARDVGESAGRGCRRAILLYRHDAADIEPGLAEQGGQAHSRAQGTPWSDVSASGAGAVRPGGEMVAAGSR